MRLTTQTDYALQVLIFLSVNEGEFATVTQVASAYGISRHHLVKVVHRLGALGWVRTTRGKGGGFALARPAAEIRVGAVVRDFEEDRSLVECFRPPAENHCRITPACRLSGALREAMDAFLAVLDRYTVEQIAAHRGELARLLDISLSQCR